MAETPGHRTAFTQRSGDTHVIGANGKAVNLDQAAREAAARAAGTVEAKKPQAAAQTADPKRED